jgi:AcrR family transcriptional regulator
VTQPASLRVPIQSRAHKTRSLVVAAARRAFAEHGYAATTAKTIAELARVGTGTFYHYFPDKDAVLAEICGERTQYLATEVEKITAPMPSTSSVENLLEDARKRLVRVVRLSLDYHRDDPGLHAAIEERRGVDPAIQRLMLESEATSLRRMESALALWGHDGDRQASAFMMFMLLEGAVHAHVLSQPIVSDERLVDALVEALLRIALPSSLVGPNAGQRPARPTSSERSKESRHAGRNSD